VNDEIVDRQAVEREIFTQKMLMALQRLDAVDRQARSELAREDEVIPIAAPTSTKTAIRRQGRARGQSMRSAFSVRDVATRTFEMCSLFMTHLS